MQAGTACCGPKPDNVRSMDSGISCELYAHSNSTIVINLSMPQFLHLQDGASNMLLPTGSMAE